jgi:nitrate/nitrite transport system ATP-binding protein
MPLLELKGVSKGYGPPGQRSEVLRDINLSIERGELVALVGYSGAGKTTLLSMIAGLTAPDSGTITLDGRAIREPGPERAVVFQNYSLLPWLSVFENIALAVDQVFPAWPREKRREHVARYIAMVNLTPAAHKRPAELSGGMRQRVAVARALAMEPQILLMDEPLSALDALTRATLQDEIERIWEQDHKTVLLITNDVDEGLLLADRIIPLGAGPAATLGPAQIVDIPRPRDRKALNHEPRFKQIRNEIIDYLLASAAHRRKAPAPAASRAVVSAVEVGA